MIHLLHVFLENAEFLLLYLKSYSCILQLNAKPLHCILCSSWLRAKTYGSASCVNYSVLQWFVYIHIDLKLNFHF